MLIQHDLFLLLTIVKATDLDSKEDVAVKLEHMFNESLLLSNEANVYRHISGGVGIPRVHWYGSECEYYALVLELLGPSLEDLLYFCGGKLSLKTTLMLFDQLICRLRYIHSKKILHRDIKPENFLMGTGKRGNQVFVTDPGLATHYVASDRVDPMPRPENPQGLGTPYYSSINGQLGIRMPCNPYGRMSSGNFANHGCSAIIPRRSRGSRVCGRLSASRHSAMANRKRFRIHRQSAQCEGDNQCRGFLPRAAKRNCHVSQVCEVSSRWRKAQLLLFTPPVPRPLQTRGLRIRLCL